MIWESVQTVFNEIQRILMVYRIYHIYIHDNLRCVHTFRVVCKVLFSRIFVRLVIETFDTIMEYFMSRRFSCFSFVKFIDYTVLDWSAILVGIMHRYNLVSSLASFLKVNFCIDIPCVELLKTNSSTLVADNERR